MKREQLAWAAGLFEGEGCFSISKAPQWSLAASVRSTDHDVILRLCSVLGVGKVYGPYFPPAGKTGPRKPQWQWSVQDFEGLQHVGAVLWPWLCARRRARFKAVQQEAVKRGARRYERFLRDAEITALLGTMPQQAIAARFGVSPSRITQIKQRVA